MNLATFSSEVFPYQPQHNENPEPVRRVLNQLPTELMISQGLRLKSDKIEAFTLLAYKIFETWPKDDVLFQTLTSAEESGSSYTGHLFAFPNKPHKFKLYLSEDPHPDVKQQHLNQKLFSKALRIRVDTSLKTTKIPTVEGQLTCFFDKTQEGTYQRALMRMSNEIEILYQLKKVDGICQMFEDTLGPCEDQDSLDSIVFYNKLYGSNFNAYLRKLHKQYGAQIPREKAVLLAERVIRSIRALHVRDIVHCDIKLENLLIGRQDEEETVAICDFDSAIGNSKLPTKLTSFYTSPENWLIRMQQNRSLIRDKTIDIWAAGIVLHKIVYGIFPRWAEFFDQALALASLSRQVNRAAKNIKDIEGNTGDDDRGASCDGHANDLRIEDAINLIGSMQADEMVKLPASHQKDALFIKLVKKMKEIVAFLEAKMKEESPQVDLVSLDIKMKQFIASLLQFGERVIGAIDSQPEPADPVDKAIYWMLRVNPGDRVLPDPDKLILN